MGMTATVALCALGVAVVTLGIAILVRLGRLRTGSDDRALGLMQHQLEALRQQTADALDRNTRALRETAAGLTEQVSNRLAEVNAALHGSSGVVQGVAEGLGRLSESAQQILNVGRDISSLQEILRTPKLRGVIGELFLGDLLRQVVPANHELQYRFRSGETVDAVVRLGAKLVPIDAKFPLENFRRMTESTGEDERQLLRRKFSADVRKHVDAINLKYILPDEGTLDFALMYIPAENVYYEMVVRESGDDEAVAAYAIRRRVIPVSPSTLYAHLQTILLGLRGFQIERRAAEIMELLGRLQGDFERFRDEFDTLGKHLTNARAKYDEADKRLNRFEEKLALAAPAGSAASESDLLPGRQQ